MALNTIFLFVLLLVSLVLLIKGADWLVDGSSDIARHLKVSPIFIGLTVVAFGTSLPEFVVSLVAVLTGSDGISIGNIIGSNIANIGLILGIGALIYPLKVKSSTLIHEFPFMIFSSFLFLVLANNNYLFNKNSLSIDRFDGIIFIFMFILFIMYVYRSMKKDKELNAKKAVKYDRSLSKNALYVVAGLTALAVGGNFFVDSASGIARLFGVSDAFIGVTIVAIGTSLPELFTVSIAAKKKQVDLAVGNVVGSNIFNILFVIGIVGTIQPIAVTSAVLFFDGVIMMLIMAAFLYFATIDKQVSRKEGAFLLLSYIIFLIALIVRLAV